MDTIDTQPHTGQLAESTYSFGELCQLTGVYTPAVLESCVDSGVDSGVDLGSGVDSESPCALFLTAGFLHHVGPTRLHVEMARALSLQGVAALRFDLSGVGDSETHSAGGYFTERSVAEIKQAMDTLESGRGHRKFVLFGLCSGADDALATALEDSRVVGLVMLNGYCYQAGWFKLFRLYRFYLPRLLKKEKLLNRFNALRHRFSNKAVGATSASALTAEQQAAVDQLDDDYRYVPPREQTEDQLVALCESRLDLLCIYTGSEHDDYTYAGQFLAMFPALRGDMHATGHYFARADHTLILKEDRDQIIDWVNDWFKTSAFKRQHCSGLSDKNGGLSLSTDDLLRGS